jgi:hypothetical protein
MFKKALILIPAITFSAIASEILLPSNNESTKMVITNSDVALVNEKRDFNIEKAGEYKLIYQNVPSSIMTDSVLPKFITKDNSSLVLYTQKFNNNTLSLSELINRNIGKEVVFRQYRDKNNFTLNSGTLISKDPTMIQYEKNIYTVDPNDIVFTDIPSDITIYPNMNWTVSSTPGEKSIDLTYLTSGINWSSDYTLMYDENKKSIDLSSFITVKNNSGKSYENLNLKCLSGDINIIKEENTRNFAEDKMVMMASPQAASFKEVKQEEFSGYHIYNIPFKINLNNNENTQIAFLNKNNIPATKINKIEKDFESLFYRENTFDEKFDQFIEFKNDKKLNIVLPAGKIKMYERYNGDTIFIGEDKIDNTSTDEAVTLNYGKNFDTKASFEILSKNNPNEYTYNGSYKIKLNNGAKKQNDVIIKLNIRSNSGKFNFSSECSGICSYKTSTRFVEYKISLEPNSTYEFKSDFNITR